MLKTFQISHLIYCLTTSFEYPNKLIQYTEHKNQNNQLMPTKRTIRGAKQFKIKNTWYRLSILFFHHVRIFVLLCFIGFRRCLVYIKRVVKLISIDHDDASAVVQSNSHSISTIYFTFKLFFCFVFWMCSVLVLFSSSSSSLDCLYVNSQPKRNQTNLFPFDFDFLYVFASSFYLLVSILCSFHFVFRRNQRETKKATKVVN